MGGGEIEAVGAGQGPYEVITFDCYGTLIDWEAGIADAFASAGITIDRTQLLELYHSFEPAVQAERFRTYRDVLSEVARRIGAAMGQRWSRDDAQFLADSVPSWPPFPETGRALASLQRAGLALGILSNVDDDLLQGTLEHFPVAFEFLVTAQEVESYKPKPPHFLRARSVIAGRPWLHTAQSYFHDIQPAVALGVPALWVNRKQEPCPDSPGFVAQTRDLDEAARWITSRNPES